MMYRSKTGEMVGTEDHLINLYLLGRAAATAVHDGDTESLEEIKDYLRKQQTWRNQ